jgi:hypothetical protein
VDIFGKLTLGCVVINSNLSTLGCWFMKVEKGCVEEGITVLINPLRIGLINEKFNIKK